VLATLYEGKLHMSLVAFSVSDDLRALPLFDAPGDP